MTLYSPTRVPRTLRNSIMWKTWWVRKTMCQPLSSQKKTRTDLTCSMCKGSYHTWLENRINHFFSTIWILTNPLLHLWMTCGNWNFLYSRGMPSPHNLCWKLSSSARYVGLSGQRQLKALQSLCAAPHMWVAWNWFYPSFTTLICLLFVGWD